MLFQNICGAMLIACFLPALAFSMPTNLVRPESAKQKPLGKKENFTTLLKQRRTENILGDRHGIQTFLVDLDTNNLAQTGANYMKVRFTVKEGLDDKDCHLEQISDEIPFQAHYEYDDSLVLSVPLEGLTELKSEVDLLADSPIRIVSFSFDRENPLAFPSVGRLLGTFSSALQVKRLPLNSLYTAKSCSPKDIFFGEESLELSLGERGQAKIGLNAAQLAYQFNSANECLVEIEQWKKTVREDVYLSPQVFLQQCTVVDFDHGMLAFAPRIPKAKV